MSEHSRGPWRVDGLAIVDREGNLVGRAEPVEPEQATANAELMAHAPQLLLAVRRLLLEVSDNEARRLIERLTHTHRRAK